MIEQTHLYDVARPHRRIYKAPDANIYVKIYTVQRALPFGALQWDFTASVCDAAGKALLIGEDHAVLRDANGAPLRHELRVESESLEPIATRLEQARLTFARRAVIAARHHAETQALY
jgi:hypothetical protein